MVKITQDQCKGLSSELGIPSNWNDKGEFCSVDLKSSWLSRSNLKDVIMRFGEAENIDLRFSDMEKGDFQRVNFKEGDFKKANFEGADFKGANFQGANFEGSDMQGADFEGANLNNATMSRDQAPRILWLKEAYKEF